MLSYKHFTLKERECLYQKLKLNWSIRKIAEFLGRNPSSVSREIKRNSTENRYSPWKANELAHNRQRKEKFVRFIPNNEEWNYIIDKLKKYWSPEIIALMWNKENKDKSKICFSTIYRYIKKGIFPEISQQKNCRRRGKKRINRSNNYNSIKPDRIIPEWTEEIINRKRIGDWEADTVYGGIGKGVLVTLVDRKSRLLLAGVSHTRNADEVKEVILKLLENMPVHTISFDNGSEFAKFREIEKELNCLVYFAQPHKPWQRGSNENANDCIRFFFPKGSDFKALSEDYLNECINLINNRPKKCLNLITPIECFAQNGGVALA